MKPSLGRVVLVRVDPRQNNGSDEAPATITRVFGEHPDGGWVVNVRVQLDAFEMPLWLTSVRLFDEPSVGVRDMSHTAWWPPRA